MPYSPADTVDKLRRQIAGALWTLLVLGWWFTAFSLATAFLAGLVDNLLMWTMNLDVGLTFCQWYGKLVSYDSLIDPLPFHFFVGISGGALAVSFVIRRMMSAPAGKD